MDTVLSQLLDASSPKTLLDLLGRYRVVVPAIQRHYVQGANTAKAKTVRGRFLNDIFSHFLQHPHVPFKLDYIFGPIRTEGDDAFVPVDGQQRLTTLWLLARYAAEKVSCDETRSGLLRLLAKFTYEGRVYARRFCSGLTRQGTPKWWKDNGGCCAHLKPSVVLRRLELLNAGWVVDATVSSMVVMLDAIHEMWIRSETVGPKSIDAEQFLEFLWTQVRFELCHDQFADDIYMKMNARGLELTQWENAKGKFAELFSNKQEADEKWNSPIEAYSDHFFSLFRDIDNIQEKALPALPDMPFFALLGRLVVYEAFRSGNTEAEMAKHHPALIALSRSKVLGEFPYVPYSDFSSILPEERLITVLQRFLKLLEFFAVTKVSAPAWWKTNMGVGEKIFYPQNDNDRDLSLLFYEYAATVENESIDVSTLSDVARLFYNLLENVSRDNSHGRLSRIVELFLENGVRNPYLRAIHASLISEKEPLAYLEEIAKSELYRTHNQEALENLWVIEESLHGRCRLAVLDIANRNIPTPEHCHARLAELADLCRNWQEHSDARRAIFCHIVKVMPFALKADLACSLDSNNALRDILCTRNDEWFQPGLLPYPRGGEGYDLSHPELRPWQRDWRVTLCGMIEENRFLPLDDQHRNGTVSVRSSGHYLIRTGRKNITGAWPLSDWRSDLLLRTSAECLAILEEMAPGLGAISMNDSNTRSAWRNAELSVYLSDTGIYVRSRSGNNVIKTWTIEAAMDGASQLKSFLQGVLHDLQELDDVRQ